VLENEDERGGAVVSHRRRLRLTEF
jgi:hypothetical protein